MCRFRQAASRGPGMLNFHIVNASVSNRDPSSSKKSHQPTVNMNNIDCTII